MSEDETKETPYNPAYALLDIMDLAIGEQAMFIPVGGNGNGFQGELVQVIMGDDGLLIFVIKNAVDQFVNVNWTNCVMATRVPAGPAGETLDPEALLKIADESGIDVPDDVREAIANLES